MKRMECKSIAFTNGDKSMVNAITHINPIYLNGRPFLVFCISGDRTDTYIRLIPVKNRSELGELKKGW